MTKRLTVIKNWYFELVGRSCAYPNKKGQKIQRLRIKKHDFALRREALPAMKSHISQNQEPTWEVVGNKARMPAQKEKAKGGKFGVKGQAKREGSVDAPSNNG